MRVVEKKRLSVDGSTAVLDWLGRSRWAHVGSSGCAGRAPGMC